MIYEYTLTVPAGTTKASPASEVLKLDQGIIHQVDVIFRAGCRYQVHLVINRALTQIIPSNDEGTLTGDWFPITGTTLHELREPPFQLEAYGWAPNTTYDHTVTIRIWLARREEIYPEEAESPILERLGRLFLGRGR